MAASSNSNQINLSPDQEGEVNVSGTVVLLKDENLTLASNNAAVDFSNYGNYKAVKVSDDSGNAQYIVSMKGVKDIVKFAVRNKTGTIVEYPVMQHSFEYSDNTTPLDDFDERNNQALLYDSSVGGNQSRTQRFDDIYQVEVNGKFVSQAKFDLLKLVQYIMMVD